MRRLVVGGAAACTVALACASMGTPPGGPQRTTPPALVKTSPESGAVNVTAQSVEFQYDAIISDRGGGGELANFFLLSPDEGTTVRWHRERVEVRPKRGFRAGTAYSVTALPGISDLNNNTITTPRTITFSTGPAIPPFAVTGRVFDWAAERIAPGARVAVVRRSDSLPYVGISDSTGMFSIGPLEQGEYRVHALIDVNRNRELDANEPWDSAGAVVSGASPFVEMRAVLRDTIPPRLLTVAVRDSVTLAVSFDRLLHPAEALSPSAFRVLTADSTPVPVARVATQAQILAQRAARDTATARDSTARDSTARDSTARDSTARDSTARDTVARTPGTAAPARPSVPPPIRDLVLQFDSTASLKVGVTYRVGVTGARGLLGPPRDSDRTFTVPKPDTTRAAAPPDSTRPRPTRPPGRP